MGWWQLIDTGNVDTVYRDVYLARTRTLMAGPRDGDGPDHAMMAVPVMRPGGYGAAGSPPV
ncbi:MAG TPA: hypothetical protein VN646_07225 [Candidatus Acidoferrum sp.]|nr:hypothetical protein [Candidatus Acidoferrum sp.]